MSTADELKELGNKALSNKQFDEAIDYYTKAIELKQDHVYYSNRSAAYLSKGDTDNSLADGAKCIEISPSWPKGYSRKGAALHAAGLYDDALDTYEAGLKVAPDDAALKNAVNDVMKAKNSSRGGGGGGGMGGLFGPNMLSKLAGHPKFGPKLADPNFVRKLNLVQSNPQLMMSDPEIMEVLQAILGQGGGGDDEDYVPSSSNRGSSSSSSSSKPTKMEVDPEPEFELTPEEKASKELKKKAAAAKEKGNAYYKEKKFQEAIAAYDEAFSIDPTNMMYLNNKAAVYIEMGECDRAFEICNEALEVGKVNKASYEDRAKVYQRIASAHLKKKDIKAAIEAYGKAQLEFPDKSIAAKIKNLELDFKKQKKEEYINPQLGLEAKERGNAAFREGRFGDAINEYEEAVKRDPTNAPFRNNLAAAYQKMGLFNDAKREVEKSLELDKKYVKAWAKKGDIEFFMKEYHKALESYKTGLILEEGNSLCKDGLRKVQAKIASENYSPEADNGERAAHAMADPEIQAILMDPIIRNVLNDFAEDPKSAQAAMKDATVRAKIEKLIAAGVVRTG